MLYSISKYGLAYKITNMCPCTYSSALYEIRTSQKLHEERKTPEFDQMIIIQILCLVCSINIAVFLSLTKYRVYDYGQEMNDISILLNDQAGAIVLVNMAAKSAM